MKNNFFGLLIFSSILINSKPAFAQNENISRFELGMIANHFYDGNSFWGGGASAKFLLSTRRNNYFTAGLVYDLFIEPDIGKQYYYHFLNAAGGYRKMINSFFIEPQIGLGIYWESGDQPGFGSFGGIETGVHLKNFTISFNPRLMIEDGFFMADGYLCFGLKFAIRFNGKERY